MMKYNEMQFRGSNANGLLNEIFKKEVEYKKSETMMLFKK